MIEFNKIFCDLHPNELISNYCSHDQCNLGLCATCICSHTELHIQRRTAPDYENIRTTYSKMQDGLRTRISALEHQKSRINLLIEGIHAKRLHVSEAIALTRRDALAFVNQFYDAKEKEVLRKVEADEKKLGLHNENRMESLMNMASRDVNSLFAAAQDLNSQNFLENFNRIRTQVLANSQQTQKEISEELYKNENYDVTLNVNPAFLNDIKIGLERSITIIWDDRTKEDKGSRQVRDSRDVRDSREGRDLKQARESVSYSSTDINISAPAMLNASMTPTYSTFNPNATSSSFNPNATGLSLGYNPNHNSSSNLSVNYNTGLNTNANRSSRIVVNPNEGSGITMQKRVSDSLPKPVIGHSHSNRNVSQAIPAFFAQQQAHQQAHQQAQQQAHQQVVSRPVQPVQYQPQSFTFRPETFMPNNSMPAQSKPNLHSRMQLRPTSQENGIKENGRYPTSDKHPLSQSYMESSFNHLSTPQLDASKKIRRSGLTVLRSVDNEKTK